ncbi:MAG: winged helix-turn-helix domain-containing protein [Chlorobaculum sp.]|nr:winged helix-turn-helix domain-containing protein [Chlorobaculum sp.]
MAQAKAALASARTKEALREAQAVLLPLEHGLSMDEVAAILGISRGWACKLRRRFISSGGCPSEPKAKRGGRRRENMTFEDEVDFLAPYLEKAARGGILVVSEIKQALDQRLGRTTALASTYNLLHRHGWRKLAPDKRHPKNDPEAQDTY